ncbi:MAG TPA: hypothetical protein DCR91_02595 [Eubacterium sp.]|nr:hypothetical protein [Eubacterium sp.]HAX60723.1 hypothetical protein [Eubacterium sp.]HAZ85070.1 hypothetical protein [Eubacterium sp.]
MFPQFKNLPATETGRKFFLSWSHYIKLMRIENLDERHFYESVIESSKLMDYIFKEWNMINSVDMKGLVNYGKQN